MGMHGAAAMDPGVRTFMAIYDADGPVTSGWRRYAWKLGGRNVFACPDCRYGADRGTSATRNILLCYLIIHNIYV